MCHVMSCHVIGWLADDLSWPMVRLQIRSLNKAYTSLSRAAMSYNAYDTQKCKGWIQRCEKEVASRENFWKNEMIRSRKKAQMADDASSVVSSYVSGQTSSTMNTVALKDKIKTLESKLQEERMRREVLENEMKSMK